MISINFQLLFLVFTILFSNLTNATFPLAILHLEGQLGSADVCAIYNPDFSAIPMELASAPKYKVFVPDPPDGCSEYIDVKSSWNSSSFVTSEGNCTQFEKFRQAYYGHARQVVVVKSGSLLEDFETGTHHQHNQVHLSVGMISSNAWNKVQKLGNPIYSQLYHPHEPLFDPNIIIIWMIAVFTVSAGAYWSGSAFQQSGSKVIEQNLFDLDWTEDKKNSSLNENSTQPADDREDDFPITVVMVVVFVLMICVVLLLLYFFYKYLIYVVIGLFSLATISGTYQCLAKLMSFLECGQCKVPENKIPILKKQPQVRNVLLFIGCVFLSLFCLYKRNTSYAWILQDFLGICFCISVIKMIKLPNLKISAILLVSLLVYDIFFVFITPLFSARGKSVMVEVATGNGNMEQLPMVVRVPKFYKSPISLCERPYSLLGFGDILLPGIFVAFCHNFDVIVKAKYKVYFLATTTAYGIGLVITFVALILMEVGQPALLYLAPSVLLAATAVGIARKELRALWIGRVERMDRQEPKGSTCEDANEEKTFLLKHP